MASTTLDPIADRLVTIAGALGVDPTVKAHKWPPVDTLKRPAAVIEMPTVRRTEPDEREDHISQVDWRVTFPVYFYFDIGEPQTSQGRAVEVIEAWIKAIDADGDLGGTVLEAKVVESGPPEYVTTDAPNSRSFIRYLTRVSILTFV